MVTLVTCSSVLVFGKHAHRLPSTGFCAGLNHVHASKLGYLPVGEDADDGNGDDADEGDAALSGKFSIKPSQFESSWFSYMRTTHRTDDLSALGVSGIESGPFSGSAVCSTDADVPGK